LTRRLAVALLLTALAGCGHNSKESRADSAAQPAPSAHPTGAEYRAIVREYRALRPLSSGDDDDLAGGRRICAALTRPDTKLIRLVRADCDNAIDFFAALRGVEHAIDECAGGVPGAGIPCARERYRALAAAIAQTRRGGVSLNDELAHRRITGLCARSIGMTVQQVAGYQAAERYARDAASALEVRDSAAFERATDALGDALNAGASNNALEGIEKDCRPPKTKPLPRLPSGGTVDA
jgi:hypothetical protein